MMMTTEPSGNDDNRGNNDDGGNENDGDNDIDNNKDHSTTMTTIIRRQLNLPAYY